VSFLAGYIVGSIVTAVAATAIVIAAWPKEFDTRYGDDD
jgi:hypothetical protein